jgi:MoxR-like ATPase
MLNILVPYPSAEEEEEIVATTTAAPLPEPEPVMAAEEVLAYQQLVRRVPLPADVLARATALVRRSRPGADAPPYVAQWVKWGAGPRAAQHLILAAKAAALLAGDFAVTLDEIERLVKPVLRHRLVLNFVAEAEGVTPDDILERLLADTLT